MPGIVRQIGENSSRIAPFGMSRGRSREQQKMIEDAIRVVLEALGEQGLRDERLVLVGGGSLDEAAAAAIGADVYCPDAAAAIETAERLSAR